MATKLSDSEFAARTRASAKRRAERQRVRKLATGMVQVGHWLPVTVKARLDELAVTLHTSPSEIVAAALIAFDPSPPLSASLTPDPASSEFAEKLQPAMAITVASDSSTVTSDLNHAEDQSPSNPNTSIYNRRMHQSRPNKMKTSDPTPKGIANISANLLKGWRKLVPERGKIKTRDNSKV